jgi:hypothetical protein
MAINRINRYCSFVMTMKTSNKQIVKKGEFHIDTRAMYEKWSTQNGLLTFFGRDNKIELTPGGAFKTLETPSYK